MHDVVGVVGDAGGDVDDLAAAEMESPWPLSTNASGSAARLVADDQATRSLRTGWSATCASSVTSTSSKPALVAS